MSADSPLIEVASLVTALASAEPPTVLDVRWRLAGPPGLDDYLVGHIPGAAFVDLDAELCGTPGAGGRHPLPDPQQLQEVLRACGVRANRAVVCYDLGDSNAAARLWWTLRWAGHRDVRVLNGGLPACLAAGQPVESGKATPEPGDFTVQPGGMPVLDAAGAAATAGNGVLLDARIAGRFRGEIEPVDPVAGRIPDAVNLPAADLAEADGRLLDAAELRERFERVGVRFVSPDGAAQPIGAYCGSGVTAAHTVLALAVAGRPDAPLYVGSWSHWITDPDRPVATG